MQATSDGGDDEDSRSMSVIPQLVTNYAPRMLRKQSLQ